MWTCCRPTGGYKVLLGRYSNQGCDHKSFVFDCSTFVFFSCEKNWIVFATITFANKKQTMPTFALPAPETKSVGCVLGQCSAPNASNGCTTQTKNMRNIFLGPPPDSCWHQTRIRADCLPVHETGPLHLQRCMAIPPFLLHTSYTQSRTRSEA